MLILAFICANQFGSPEDSGLLVCVCVFNNTINQSASDSLLVMISLKIRRLPCVNMSFLSFFLFFYYLKKKKKS